MCDLAMKAICIGLLLVRFASESTGVTVENGGYSVLVSFSQNVQSADGMKLLEKTKESLEHASTILHNATGLQFTKVTFQIPHSWNISEMNINVDGTGVPRNSKADFLIDGTSDVIFGKFPYAQQYGSCGTPGHQIIVPTVFFSDDNKFPKGTAIAREWLKYRYGVFDENGYERDLLYPQSYVLPGDDPAERKVTDCAESPITYNFSENGNVVPDEASLGNITSSLMYFHQDIPGMQYVCGKRSDHQHNALSPNKHNAMCRSRSVWDVVRQSGDFQKGAVSEKYKDIEFVYDQERSLKLVVAWETTFKIGEDKGKIIKNAIKRFVYEIPRGTKFTGFPFPDNLSKRDYTLKELDNQNDKNAIVNNINGDFVTKDGNLNDVLSKALDILAADSSKSEPAGTVVIIAKSGGVPSDTLLQRLEKAEVCVKVLSIKNVSSETTETYASNLPCGSQVEVYMDEDEDMFNTLFESMEAILPAIADDKTTETVQTGCLSEGTSITLEVDETVEKVTFWMFTEKLKQNFQLEFDGEKQEMEELQDVETTKDIRAFSFSPTKAGKIDFAFPHVGFAPILTQVRVTSKAGKYLNGVIFVQDTSEISSTDQMPVIMYIALRYGAYPVQNANVKAIIERPNDEDITLEMFDDGRGDPDITMNDGVYSRYFTQFSEKGEYTVRAEVEITELTSYGIDENSDYRSCCGSSLETVQSTIPATTKTFTTTFTAKNGRPDQGYKPSRIADLRIGEFLGDRIVLKWSAPGEEGDTGTVQSYEINLYTSHKDAVKAQNGITRDNTTTPLERGNTQSLELKFSDFSEPGIHYVTISAKNAKQTADASPILEIFIPDKDSITTPKDEDDTNNDDKNTGKAGIDRKTALIIGLAVGLTVLLILVFLVVYFVFVRSKRKEEAKSNSAAPTVTSERGENHVINPISFISADTLLRNHNQRTIAKIENKEPPIFREEDFEDRHSSETPDPRDNNNASHSEDCNNTLHNEGYLPPKSPKKTTYV